MSKFLLLITCALLALLPYGNAQVIKGVIQDREDQAGLDDVQIYNVHTNTTGYGDSTGHFSISANKGQLIEMRKAGYRIARFRIPQGYIPPYFRIYMEKIAVLNTDRFASSNLSPYQKDSLLTYELYKHWLEFPQLKGYEKIQSPFSALSKKNRQIWAFQDLIEEQNKEKYVDYTFNPELVSSLTGLKGDSLQYYMRRFRPDHDALRTMKMIEFYQYIKRTAEFYRRSRGSTPRTSG